MRLPLYSLSKHGFILRNRISKKQFDINATWTAVILRQGWRHYRIAGRRYSDARLEFELMAVCDRSIRFWVSEEELRDGAQWQPGWQEGIVDT